MAAVERRASSSVGGGEAAAAPRGAAPGGGAVRALLLLLLLAVALPAAPCTAAPAGRPAAGKGWAERLQALTPAEVGDLSVYRARG